MLLVDKSSTSSNGDESRTPVNVEADNNAKLPVVSSTDKKDLLEMEVDLLKADIQRLKGEVACLEKTKFCYRIVSLNEELLPHYTGLPNKGIFNSVHRICQKYLSSYYCGWSSTLCTEDQLFITCKKCISYESILLQYGHKVLI